jgi:hypothetical protein
MLRWPNHCNGARFVTKTELAQPLADGVLGYGGREHYTGDFSIPKGVVMFKEMANIAAECVKSPTRRSVWSAPLAKYVCVDTLEGKETLAHMSVREAAVHPPIDPQFKLVFVTAISGTVTFIVLCLVLSLLAGKEPPPLFEKIILGFFDMAKIGFGAIVGLLGGKKLAGEDAKAGV